jgi:hypothetical protein
MISFCARAPISGSGTSVRAMYGFSKSSHAARAAIASRARLERAPGLGAGEEAPMSFFRGADLSGASRYQQADLPREARRAARVYHLAEIDSSGSQRGGSPGDSEPSMDPNPNPPPKHWGRGIKNPNGRVVKKPRGTEIKNPGGRGIKSPWGMRIKSLSGRSIKNPSASGIRSLSASGIKSLGGSGIRSIAASGMKSLGGSGTKSLSVTAIEDPPPKGNLGKHLRGVAANSALSATNSGAGWIAQSSGVARKTRKSSRWGC